MKRVGPENVACLKSYERTEVAKWIIQNPISYSKSELLDGKNGFDLI